MSEEFEPIPGVTVIGFGHKARQGKDTAVNAIVNGFDGAMRFSFADDLYAYCRVVYGMTTKDAPLLQRIGVEKREEDPETWVRCVYAKMLEAKPRIALISDVRFPNEMAFIKALGGAAVRVTRFNNDYTPYVDPSRPADHISEIALDDAAWDYTLRGYSGYTTALGVDASRVVLHVLAEESRR